MHNCFVFICFAALVGSLAQVYLLWGKDTPELWADVSDKFLDALKRRWTDNQQRTKRSSFSHLEVSQVGVRRSVTLTLSWCWCWY